MFSGEMEREKWRGDRGRFSVLWGLLTWHIKSLMPLRGEVLAPHPAHSPGASQSAQLQTYTYALRDTHSTVCLLNPEHTFFTTSHDLLHLVLLSVCLEYVREWCENLFMITRLKWTGNFESTFTSYQRTSFVNETLEESQQQMITANLFDFLSENIQ